MAIGPYLVFLLMAHALSGLVSAQKKSHRIILLIFSVLFLIVFSVLTSSLASTVWPLAVITLILYVGSEKALPKAREYILGLGLFFLLYCLINHYSAGHLLKSRLIIPAVISLAFPLVYFSKNQIKFGFLAVYFLTALFLLLSDKTFYLIHLTLAFAPIFVFILVSIKRTTNILIADTLTSISLTAFFIVYLLYGTQLIQAL